MYLTASNVKIHRQCLVTIRQQVNFFKVIIQFGLDLSTNCHIDKKPSTSFHFCQHLLQQKKACAGSYSSSLGNLSWCYMVIPLGCRSFFVIWMQKVNFRPIGYCLWWTSNNYLSVHVFCILVITTYFPQFYFCDLLWDTTISTNETRYLIGRYFEKYSNTVFTITNRDCGTLKS